MLDGVKEEVRINNMYFAQIMAECDALIGEKDEAITSLEIAVNLGAVNYPLYSEIVNINPKMPTISIEKCPVF